MNVLAPLALYGDALHSPAGVRVRGPRGVAELPISRWAGPADAADELALSVVGPPVLDIGCGPGRHLALLAAAGIEALGIDPSPQAVALAARRGGRAVVGSVFSTVPDAGHYGAALLLDGNIGIGGDPVALLRRVRGLLTPGGTVVVEVDARRRSVDIERVRLERPGAVSTWFDWARVGSGAIAAIALAADLLPARELRSGRRAFVTLERRA